jgi:hypothetical protein
VDGLFVKQHLKNGFDQASTVGWDELTWFLLYFKKYFT